MNSLMPISQAMPLPANPSDPQPSEVRLALIQWLRAYRDDNRLDEVIMAQLARCNALCITGQGGAEGALLACETAEASGQRMIASLKAKQPPEGLPPEDVRALHLALQTAILMYEHQALMLDAHHALLTELLPYRGMIENTPASDPTGTLPRVHRLLRTMREYQKLSEDATNQSGGFFFAVATRWGLRDILIGFG